MIILRMRVLYYNLQYKIIHPATGEHGKIGVGHVRNYRAIGMRGREPAGSLAELEPICALLTSPC